MLIPKYIYILEMKKIIPMKTLLKGLKLHHYNKYILITWINLTGSQCGSLAEN